MNCPPVTNTLLTVTSVPRFSGGAASAMYIGTAVEVRPTAIPTTARPTSSISKFSAVQSIAEPAMKTIDAKRMTGCRPSLVVAMLLRHAEAMHPIKVTETISSCCLLLNSNSLTSSSMAPETTPVS